MKTNLTTAGMKKALVILCGIGFFVSICAGLTEHFEWLCMGFSDGCRQTTEFDLFGASLWLWGAGLYVLLLLSVFCVKRLVFWLVVSAFGVEIQLVWIMLTAKAICVLCIGNFIVVILLLALCFEKRRFWHAVSASTIFFLLSSFVFLPQVEDSFASPENEQGKIVATVAGKTITSEELERPLATRIYDLQRKIYRLKRNRLDYMIAEILLKKEADKKGVAVEQLINESILSNGVLVTDEEVNRFYQENRGKVPNWKGTEEELKRRMKVSLQERKGNQMIMEYARSLRGKYDVVDYLREPPLPHTKVSVSATDPVSGPSNAPVTIVEFSDYLCSACRKHHQVVQEIREMYKGQIRWIFKDFPGEGHKKSERAAEAALCAAEQGKFWEYQDLLFTSDRELTLDTFKRSAKKLELDMDSFERCLKSRKFQPEIEMDMEEGKKAGVAMTPSFIVNGKLIPGGPPLERFKQIIEEELKSKKTAHVEEGNS